MMRFTVGLSVGVGTCLLSAGIGSAGSVCPSDAWSSHTTVANMTSLAVDGDTLWVGSLFGGVLEWDTTTQTGRIYSRTAHCLPSNEVLDIAVAPNGDVWIATFMGAARRPAGADFNTNWDLFNADNSGLSDQTAQSVGIVDSGAVWIGVFEEGAFRFENDMWENFGPLNSGLTNTTVLSIENVEDVVWFGTFGGGVFRLDNGVFTQFTPGNTGTPPGFCQVAMSVPPDQLGLTSGVVEVRHVDAMTGVAWISSLDDGFCVNSSTSRFDGRNWLTFSTFNSDIASDVIEGATTAPDGREVITSLNGSQFFDIKDQSFTDITYDNGDPLRATDVERRGNELWFTAPGRLVRWVDGELTEFTTPALSDNLVEDMVVFDDGGDEPTVWIGNREGAQRLTDDQWQSFTPSNSPIAGFDVNAVARGLDGSLWFGTAVNGISRFDGKNWTTFTAENSGLASNNINALAVDPNTGDIWAAYNFAGGSARFDGEKWNPSSVGPNFGTNDLVVDQDSNVWFAGSNTVLRMAPNGQASVVTDGLPSKTAWALAVGPNNEIYIGTADGAAVMNTSTAGGSWTPLPDVNQFVNNIQALAVDSDGHLWAGAWDVGLAEFDGKSWTVHTTADGLVNSRPHVIQIASDDTVWVGTEMGISVFDQNFTEGPLGDLNGDGNVNGQDLLILLNGWGTAGATDLDNSGITSGSDLLILLNNWG